MTIEILSVKEYNRQAAKRYHDACAEWHERDPKYGGFPAAGMYLYYNNKGNERQSGFILKDAVGSRWFKTKREAEAYAMEKASKKRIKV